MVFDAASIDAFDVYVVSGQEVEAWGYVSDENPEGVQVQLSGAISATVTPDEWGYFEWTGDAANLGGVTAVASDDEGLTSSPASAELTSDAPQITFTVEPTGAGREVEVTGSVTDESPEGLTVALSGVVTGSLTVDESGQFSGIFEASSVGTVSASTNDVWGLASDPSTFDLRVAPPTLDVSITSPGGGLEVEITGTVDDVSPSGLTVNITGALTGALVTDSAGAFSGPFTKTTSGDVFITVTNEWGLESIPEIISVEVLDLDFSGDLAAHTAAASGGLAAAEAAVDAAQDDLEEAQADLKTELEQQNNNAITQRETAQAGYDAAISNSVADYEAAIAAATADHQIAMDAAQAAFDSTADALQATYDAAVAQAQQEFDTALAAAESEQSDATADADAIYSLAMAAADLVYQAHIAAAESDYADAAADADAVYDGAVASAQGAYDSAVAAADLAFESAEFTAQGQFVFEMDFILDQFEDLEQILQGNLDAVLAQYPNVSYDAELAESDPGFQATVVSADDALAAVIAAAESTYQDAYGVGLSAFLSQIDAAQTTYNDAVMVAQTENQQRIDDAYNAYDAAFAAAEQLLNDGYSMAEQVFNSGISVSDAVYQIDFDFATNEFDQDIANSESTFENAVTLASDDYNLQLDQLTTQFNDAVSQRQQQYDQNGAQLSSDFDQQVATAQQTRDDADTAAENLHETTVDNSEILRDSLTGTASADYDDVVQSADQDLNWASAKYWGGFISESDFFDAAKTYSLDVALANTAKTSALGGYEVNHVERVAASGTTKSTGLADAAYTFADTKAAAAKASADSLADEFQGYRKDVAGYEADFAIGLAPEFSDLMLDIALADKNAAYSSAAAEETYRHAMADAGHTLTYLVAAAGEVFANDEASAWQSYYQAVARAEADLQNALAASEAQYTADEAAAAAEFTTDRNAALLPLQFATHAARTLYVTAVSQGMQAWVDTVAPARAATIKQLSNNDPDVAAVANAHAAFEIGHMQAMTASIISSETVSQTYDTVVLQASNQRDSAMMAATQTEANAVAAAAVNWTDAVTDAGVTLADEEAAAEVDWSAAAAAAERQLVESQADADQDFEYAHATAERQRQEAEADAQLASDQGYWPQYTVYTTAVANADKALAEAEADAQAEHLKNAAQAEYDKALVDAAVEHAAVAPVAARLADVSIKEAQLRAAEDNVQAYENYQEVVDTPAAEFEYLVTTITDILPWLDDAIDATVSWLESEWEIIVAAWNDPLPVAMAYYMGLGQGALNTVNGVQDAIIGIANLPIMAINFHPIMLLTGNSIPYIPSPDWSRGVLVEEDETLHDVSKFLGGEGVMTLATLGFGQARHAGKLRWLDDVAHWLTGSCFVAGTQVVMGHDPALLSNDPIPVMPPPDDTALADLDWTTIISVAMTLPIALTAVVAARKKKRGDEREQNEIDDLDGDFEPKHAATADHGIDEVHRLAALTDEPYQDDASAWESMLSELPQREVAQWAAPCRREGESFRNRKRDARRPLHPSSRGAAVKSSGRRLLPWFLATLAVSAALLVAFWAGGGDSPSRPSDVSLASAAETPELLTEIPTKAIEDVRVGERVMGRNPDPTDAERNLPEPDPATWRQVELRMQKASGKSLAITLLRPTAWIESSGAAVNTTIQLDMKEMDAVGPAEVLSIAPCPEIHAGPGQVVTGTFSHEPDDNLVDVHIQGIQEPIGCTNNHRFWSETRRDFVEAGDLLAGEQVRTRTLDLARVESVSYRPPEQRVYNLEVHGEHVYEVSDAGVLVHNSYSNAVVIGERMTRVHAVADALTARTLVIRTKLPWTVGKNRQWMGRIASNVQNANKGGIRRILDVGPKGASPTSPWYIAEREVLRDHGFVPKFLKNVVGTDGQLYGVWEWVIP